MSDTQVSVQGTLHYIPPNLSFFEPIKAVAPSSNTNTLIWIGGLFDTYLSVEYPVRIAQAFGPTWTLAAATLSSSGLSWGVTDISRDAEEIAKIVAFIKEERPQGKVVIMGHSTGTQDCMEYLTGAKAAQHAKADGVIFQAPVSDREALESHLPQAFLHEANQLALKMCREGKGMDAMPHRLMKPVFDRVAVTAKRWVDIASPGPNHEGADDFFSSDLPDERLKGSFGKLSVPALILFGGADESVPSKIDKEALVKRWFKVGKDNGAVLDEENGGIVPGASHNLNGNPDAVVKDLVGRVVRFVERVEKAEFSGSAASSRT